MSGGSAANLTAMACAREALVGAMSGELVAYVSEQGHSSLARAARVLGFGPQQVRVLPVDDAVPDAYGRPRGSDRRGPRSRGVVRSSCSPLPVRRTPGPSTTCLSWRGSVGGYGVWLHVDGAYGAFAALTERGREALTGLELADSVTLDPHKWLYQPFECGAVLVRRGHLLKEAFEIHPSYLQDTTARDGAVNFADRGLQLTRMSRALKLWVSLQYFGVDAFAAAIDRAMDLAEHAQRRDRGGTRPGADGAGHPGHRLLPPAPARARRRGGPGAGQRHARRRPRGERRGARLLHPAVRPLRRPPVRAQPRHDDVRRRPGAAMAGDGDLPRRGRRGVPERARSPGDQDRGRRRGLAGTGRGRRRRAPIPAAPRGRR